jgi:hypothetical protein
MYGWKSRSSKSLKESLPSVPYVLQLVQVPPMLLYTVHHITRTAVVSSHSHYAKLVSHDAPARRAFSWWILQLSARGRRLQHKVNSRTNLASLITGIRKERVWSAENHHAIRFHQRRQFSINFKWLPRKPSRVGSRDYLNFLPIYDWGLLEEVSSMRLHMWF